MKKTNTKKQALFKIILTAILIALNVILERFLAYSVWNQTISLGFITIAFAASFLGVPYAIAVAGFGDLIGSILFPFGAYFPGFTATNCIYALILAEFIYKNATPIKCILSVITTKIVCSLMLNTLWVSILYRGGIDAFIPVLITRIPQTALMTVVEITVLIFIFSSKSKLRSTLQKNLAKLF